MRPIDRIDRIINKLRKEWHENPDQRLTQLIANLHPHAEPSNLFYVEDSATEAALDKIPPKERCPHGVAKGDDFYCGRCYADQYATEIIDDLKNKIKPGEVVIELEGGIIQQVYGAKDYLTVDWDNMEGVNKELKDELTTELEKAGAKLNG